MKGHIRKRGDNVYQLIYYTGGKHRAKTVHGTKREAEAVLANIVAGLSSGEFVAPSKQTVGGYLLQWLEQIRPSVRPKTYRSYETNCRVHIIPALGEYKLSELRPLHIQHLYAALRKRTYKAGEETRTVSSSTVASVHRTLRSALNRAVGLWLIPAGRNPIEGAEAPQQGERNPHILTPEEAGKLLEQAKEARRYSLYLAALATGLRQGELLGLRWSDVNVDNGIAEVRQQLTRGGNQPTFGEPKSKKGRRTVALPEILCAALREERAQEKEEGRLGHPLCRYDLIWHTASGTPMSPRNLDRQFKGLLKKAKLPDMRFHDLRHTHATWQAALDFNMRALQAHMGHSSISVTAIYTHPDLGAERQAAANVDKLLCKKPDEPAGTHRKYRIQKHFSRTVDKALTR